MRPADQPRHRLGAYTPAGSIAGLAEAALGEYGELWKDRAAGYVAVGPAHRRQGLGARLLDEVEAFAARAGVRWLEGEARESELSAALALVTRRGFTELERYQASRQEPAMVDLGGLEPLRERLRRQGIEITSFTSIDSEGARESLYRCTMALHRDMPHEPHVDWDDSPLEKHIRLIFENPLGLPSGIFVARDGEEVVGITHLVRRPGGDAEVWDTGVVGRYRRRGIGRALKLMATRYAAEAGFHYVYTDNRSDNEGMLAINTELGFKPSDVLVIFEKVLRPTIISTGGGVGGGSTGK